MHTGGIFAALSETTAALTIEAVKAAKKHGTIVSYDLNYRPSLWKSIGGLKKAQEVNREIAKYVDVMIGNEEDFTACLGFEVKGADHNLSKIETDAFKAMIETAVKAYPNFKVAATTLRRVITATKNDWSAILWHDGKFHREPQISGTGNSRPRRRRRQFCQRPAIRFSGIQRRAEGGGLRRGARRAGLDHARRHQHGHAQGSGKNDGRRQRAGSAVNVEQTLNRLPRQPNYKFMKTPAELFSLKGKVAVVIGGTGVLCGEMAEGLAAAGATVALVGRDAAKAQEAARQNRQGRRQGGIFLRATRRRKAGLQKLLADVLAKFGRVDVLVNGAGVNSPTPFFDIPEEEFDKHS